MTRKHRTPPVYCFIVLAYCFIGLAVLTATGYLRAQVPSPLPTFEISIVKPSSPDANHSDLNMMPFKTANVPLDTVIKFAYSLNDGSDNQIIGAPAWLHTSRFDIDTKTDAATTIQLSKLSIPDQLATSRLMARVLLADRFHLKVHHETRPIRVIVLTLANPSSQTDPKITKVPDPFMSARTQHEWFGLSNDGQGHVRVHGMPIKTFAEFLGNLPEIGGRMVVDQTGLIGTYDFTLNYTPQRLAPADDNAATTPGTTSLFAALSEQLGFKLKSTKAPVDVLVIDRVEQPSPN